MNSAEWPSKEETYQYCYCEESVFRFLQQIEGREERAFAIFVSNPKKTVAFKGHREDGDWLVWDYHVVAAVQEEEEVWIFDHSITTADSWPLSLEQWLTASFSPHLDARYHPWFRVVPWETLRKHFSSDRSHMRKSEAPVPSYDPILCDPDPTTKTNLFSHFVTMEADQGYGRVYKSLSKSAFQ